MRVGVYVDAFNVYFGGRSLCGRASQAGVGWTSDRLSTTSFDAAGIGQAPRSIGLCTAQPSLTAQRTPMEDGIRTPTYGRFWPQGQLIT